MQQKTSQWKNKRRVTKHKIITTIDYLRMERIKNCIICKAEGHNKRACIVRSAPKINVNKKKDRLIIHFIFLC